MVSRPARRIIWSRGTRLLPRGWGLCSCRPTLCVGTEVGCVPQALTSVKIKTRSSGKTRAQAKAWRAGVRLGVPRGLWRGGAPACVLVGGPEAVSPPNFADFCPALSTSTPARGSRTTDRRACGAGPGMATQTPLGPLCSVNVSAALSRALDQESRGEGWGSFSAPPPPGAQHLAARL